ncbi:unnamed protein product [Cuscuta europaea]|uniref:Uncharacterized protein n=1 Tax=Cuscuta europaea TaxID=41803 RepID=A0A9P1E5B0_CUSEU|nr:unnamed protein product [Cuscuta europaea]
MWTHVWICISWIGEGKPTEDWSLRHVRYGAIWERRAELVVIGTLTLLTFVSVDYMIWCRGKSRQTIWRLSPTGLSSTVDQ